MIEIAKHNEKAWDHEVKNKNENTLPVSHEVIAQAKKGIYTIPLTPTKPVPEKWIGNLNGKKVLCLAASGGQQAPILAAIGADVTVFDICKGQLSHDEEVAKRENLHIKIEQGDMRDLSRFEDETFDMVFHAVSNCFIESIEDVWRECYRVLKDGGTLISGFLNPVNYIFDMDEWYDNKNLVVKYSIPYSDLKQLDEKRLQKYIDNLEPLEFGHSLESQIGGQINAGFLISGFYEDDNGEEDLLDPYIKTMIATKAIKIKSIKSN